MKDEIRENLKRKLQAAEPLFPGIIGYEKTVIPQLVNSLLARHDLILLGLRGQAKTRILRQLTSFLDEWLPVLRGSEVAESPVAPFTSRGRTLAAEAGDGLEIEWVHRDDRYREKLATPDVTIADLIGDVDPLKAARDRLTLSSEDAISYGILPRANRGIFAINELPDLQPRIQVGLLNILEEKDIQIRGFPVRFPIDVLLVFSANPEDYTNRGNIITPLKDRIDSQIITHYPESVENAVAITSQEAWVDRDGEPTELPACFRELVEEIAIQARKSEYVDQASGVSARLSISAMESVVSNIERRGLRASAARYPRIIDLQAALPAISGKVELVYEGEQEGVVRVARGLVGAAVKEFFVRRFPDAYAESGGPAARRQQRGRTATRAGAEPAAEAAAERPPSEYKPILDWFAAHHTLEIDDQNSDGEYRKALDQVPGLGKLAEKHAKPAGAEERYLWMELILDGLCQRSLLARQDVDSKVLYVDLLGAMLEGMKPRQ